MRNGRQHFDTNGLAITKKLLLWDMARIILYHLCSEYEKLLMCSLIGELSSIWWKRILLVWIVFWALRKTFVLFLKIKTVGISLDIQDLCRNPCWIYTCGPLLTSSNGTNIMMSSVWTDYHNQLKKNCRDKILCISHSYLQNALKRTEAWHMRYWHIQSSHGDVFSTSVVSKLL